MQRIKSSILIIYILGIISETIAVRFLEDDDDSCTSPEGEEGHCINIKQCPPLLYLLKHSRNNHSAAAYLRRSLCKYTTSEPKVCCPSEQEDEGTRIMRPVQFFKTDVSNLPSPPSCGRSMILNSERIVGGSPSELGEWPWMVAIGFRDRLSNGSRKLWLCGGTLITQRHVLTAAHCFFHNQFVPYEVRLGDLDLNDRVNDGARPVDIRISKIIPHENYSKVKLTDDIGLLQLSQSVRFTNLIQPICLPKTPELRSSDFVGYDPFAVGWGSVMFKGPAASHLQEIQLPVVNNKVCADRFRNKVEIISRQLCAGVLTGGKDTCQGDSGGPLMLPKGEYFYIIGVVSFGKGCAEVGYPGVYTRITSYIDWISRNIDK